MKFKAVKSADEIKLDGVTIELDKTGDTINGLTITDAKGRLLRIAKRNWSDIALEVPAPPETIKMHIVSGDLLGLPVREQFAESYEATNRASAIRAAGGEVTVTLEDVVKPSEVTASTPASDDTPF